MVMEHDYQKQASVLRQLIDLNKEKVSISRQITELLDKLAEVSAKCGQLSAQLEENPPSKN